MATNIVLYLPSKATVLKFLTVIYQNPAIKLQDTTDVLLPYTSITIQFAKLVLENGQEITGENTISEFLGETHEKLNCTPELRAEAHEWLSRSARFSKNPEEVYVVQLMEKADVGVRLLDGQSMFCSSDGETYLG